jgi:hypothetical protein
MRRLVFQFVVLLVKVTLLSPFAFDAFAIELPVSKYNDSNTGIRLAPLFLRSSFDQESAF